MAELLLERTENETTPNAGVAVDVRRLINQVEGGAQFDLEWTGHAYDVCLDAVNALAARLGQASLGQGISAEIESRIERFARSTSTSNMYLRLVITDKMPDLPDYAPCQISVYDGTRSNGTDFSKVVQRATIYGTLMTSVNVTDLKAYFEGGRKRHLLVYLGTDRMGDIKALDKMLAAMPAMLQAAGMDAGAIKEMIAAVKTGNMPPAAIKMLHQMIEIGQLRMAQAQAPLSRTEQAALTKLETTIAAQLKSPAFLKSVPAIFATALKAVATAPMRVASPAMRTTPLADNDNKTVSSKDAATLVTALRALARDKTIPATQRSEIAAILLDLRAGTKITNPAPARIIAGITKLDLIVKTATATAVKLPPYILSIAAPLANITTPRYTPAVLKNMIAEIRALARDKTIPPAQRLEMAAALLDLRAGTKAVNPLPARAALGVARVSALLVDAKTVPAITVRLAGPLTTLYLASPSMVAALPTTAAVASMITSIRTMARDKTIPPAQRREMAAALLDLRAGTKANSAAPARAAVGVARVTALLVDAKTAPAITARMTAPLIAARMAPPNTPAVASMITSIRAMARDKTIPPAQRREMASALLDLRAGVKTNGAAPARAAVGVARVTALLADSKTAPAITARMTAPLIAARMSPPNTPAVASMITSIRAMARDKTIPPAQRREMAAALLDLRAGAKTNSAAPARAAVGVARVTALLADSKTAPAITARMTATLIAARMVPPNTPAVTSMITSIRAMARDKTLPPMQRREMAAALLDLRAGAKAKNPIPVRVASDVTYVRTPARLPEATPLTAPIKSVPAQTEPARMALVLNHLAPIIRTGASTPQMVTQAVTTTLANVTPKAMDLFKPVFTAMLDNKALPPQTRAAITQAIETGKPDTMARVLADNPRVLETVPPQIIAKALESIKPSDITPPNTAKVDEPKGTLKPEPTKEKPSTPQYNPDGTLKECCAEFGKAVAIKGMLEATKNDESKIDPSNPPSDPTSNPQQPPKPEWKLEDDGSVKVIGKKGEIEIISAIEVKQNIEGHKKLDAELANAQSTNLVPDKPQWSDDTSRMLSQLNAPPKGSDMRTTFTHICGPGCNHGTDAGFKADAVPATPTGQTATREVEVELIRVADTAPAKPSTSRAPRRSMRPA